MFIHNGREAFTVLGEKTNVIRCESMIKDSLNEVEEMIKLSKDELHALLIHNGKYRHMIETEYYVNTRLTDDGEGLRLMGGQNSVKQATRAIQELFRSRYSEKE